MNYQLVLPIVPAHDFIVLATPPSCDFVISYVLFHNWQEESNMIFWEHHSSWGGTMAMLSITRGLQYNLLGRRRCNARGLWTQECGRCRTPLKSGTKVALRAPNLQNTWWYWGYRVLSKQQPPMECENSNARKASTSLFQHRNATQASSSRRASSNVGVCFSLECRRWLDLKSALTSQRLVATVVGARADNKPPPSDWSFHFPLGACGKTQKTDTTHRWQTSYVAYNRHATQITGSRMAWQPWPAYCRNPVG